MELRAVRTDYATVEPMREDYRAEAGCQIVADSALRRDIADPYLLTQAGQIVGYAGVWNRYYEGRVMEFHLQHAVRRYSIPLFEALVLASNATHIRAQTNMPFMLNLAYDVSELLAVDKTLFADAQNAHLGPPDFPSLVFREVENDNPNHSDSKDYALESDGRSIATGGYLCHYNPPYADVHMEVKEEYRRQGVGSYFVHQVKLAAYANGKIPAARCDPDNTASRRTLEKAGFLPCGRLVEGPIRVPKAT